VTLEDILANGVPWKPPAIWQCTSRLIRAARALHQIGILYMRWKGSCDIWDWRFNQRSVFIKQ